MHKLIIEDDEGRTTVVPLVRDELTIGRKDGNSIRLTERNVSRRHARLFKKNGAICIEDFASYTGVRVNGMRITIATEIHDSDNVLIGDYKLSVRSDAATEGVPATMPGLPAALSPGDAAVVASAGAPPVAGVDAAVLPAVAAARPGAPAVHLDAAPTIPLRTLEEQGRAPHLPATETAPPARLVVVTSDLAGHQFPLDRPSVVIGRTEENDIILNHPSISRHHAKVVRDGERHTIVDLQSANGVRVAGESYERVDIQPGDVVELGHVKLRFVGPREEWVYDPREFAPRSRRKLKLGAAAAGAALAALLVLALQGKKPLPPPPVVVAAPAPVPTGPAPAALFAEATAAAGSENWDKAVSALDLLLSRPPGDPEAAAVATQAADLKRKVDFERRSAEIFASFEKAVGAKEPDVALSRYEELPAESVYKARAEPSLDEVKALFLAAHLDLADSARVQGRCAEAAAEVEKVQQVDPENRQARDILKKCKIRPPARTGVAPDAPASVPAAAATPAAVAPAAPRAAAPSPPAPATPKPALARPMPRAARATVAAAAPAGTRALVPTNTTAEPSTGLTPASSANEENQPDAGELIKQAREAWMRQQCGTATDLSRRALKLKPGANDAHQIIAVCACSSKDKEGALRSYSKLDERSRALVRTLCARNGVELIE